MSDIVFSSVDDVCFIYFCFNQLKTSIPHLKLVVFHADTIVSGWGEILLTSVN